MQITSEAIDVIVVKYIKSDLQKNAYNNFMSYLKTVEDINIHIHDNTTNNIGLVKARNELIKQCSCDFVCFCDTDIAPKFIDWRKIKIKLQEDPQIGIISPVTTKFSTINKLIEWQPKEYISCNMMFMRIDNFKKIGMFDEKFFVAYADWDLIKRVFLANLKILQHNTSTVDHFGLSKNYTNKGPVWRKDFSTYISKWGASGILDRTKK